MSTHVWSLISFREIDTNYPEVMFSCQGGRQEEMNVVSFPTTVAIILELLSGTALRSI